MEPSKSAAPADQAVTASGAQVLEFVQHVALKTWTNDFNQVLAVYVLRAPAVTGARHPTEGKMDHFSSDIAFTPAVKDVQSRRGSRGIYEKVEARGGFRTAITEDLAGFLAAIDTAYLATASAGGQPYAQHRGGPKGFIRVIDERTIGFADFAGNRQYISTGNLAENSKAFLFLMDYANRRRIKLWGRARIVEGDAALLARLMPDYAARPEQAILFEVDAWDANCPQHIPQKFDAADVAVAITRLEQRIATLEAENSRLQQQVSAERNPA